MLVALGDAVVPGVGVGVGELVDACRRVGGVAKVHRAPWLDDARQQRQLDDAEVAFDALTLKPLLRVLLKLERFELAIRYGEWIQSTLTTPDTELTDLIAEARHRLGQGPETVG